MNAVVDKFQDKALDERVNDFNVVRAWVFDQIQNNLPAFAHELACLLRGADKPADDPAWDYRLADWRAVDAIRLRMDNAIAEQPATKALAEQLREEAEEDAREELEDSLCAN